MVKIYGFGNALIDIEISLSEQKLLSLGIAKGSMVHISAEQKNTWLKRFSREIVSTQPGGSIANAIYAASSQKSYCTFSCTLGNDKEKDLFLNGFDNDLINIFHQNSYKQTGVCFIFVTPDGERTMASHLSANEDLVPGCIDKNFLSKSDWLIFDAFSVCTKNGFKTAKYALNIAKENKLKVGFGLADINLVKSNKSELLWVLSQSIDLIAGNENEISLLKDYISINTNVLCSLGSKGCRFNSIHAKVNSNVNIVNTNGAGDALLGIFLSYIDNLTTEKALRKAVDYATQVCQIGGPRI